MRRKVGFVRGRGRRVAYLAVVQLLGVGLPSTAGAQMVLGTVTTVSTGVPVEGAFVRLVDPAGEPVAGVLSRSDGSYVLRAPAPGRYRLRIERIGYATEEGEPFELTQTARVDVSVEYEPIPLRGFEVEQEPRCGAPSATRGELTALLWEEARKALEVAVWTREEPLQFEVEAFQRVLDGGTRVEEEDARRRWRVGREAFRSVPADSLDRHGYVQTIADEDVYFAPDAVVLLSDTFLGAHCFGVVEADRRVGLTFSPLGDRDVSDIEGTLWFSADSLLFEQLEFRYTRLPDGIRDRRLGGEVDFERLPGGAWIIRDWRIRRPLETIVSNGRRPRVTTYLEEGGRVLSRREVRIVLGTVTDRSSAAPVGGAFVRLTDEVGEPVAGALSGADGSYAFAVPEPGRYGLAVERPGYIGEKAGPVDVAQSTRLDLAVRFEPLPWGDSVRDDPACRPLSDGPEPRALLWQEARRALEIAVWAQDEVFEFEVESFTRVLDSRGRLKEEETRQWPKAGPEAFRSVSADALDRHGYVQASEGGEVYFGPDPEVLLRDAFVRGHCFGITTSDEGVGLTFAPRAARTLPDIEGTFWFARADMGLERLEFRYTGMPSALLAEPFGGEVRFERLEGGVWAVAEWRKRAPASVRRGAGGAIVATEGVREEGGRVVRRRLFPP